MTETTKEIFDKYQVRKTRSQKRAFASYLEGLCDEYGYSYRVEKGAFGVRNLVVGEPDSAKVVYTAHYDTQPVLPFPNFITPKNIFVYILFNIAIVIGFFAVSFAIGFVLGAVTALIGLSSDIAYYASLIILYSMVFMMIFGPANKHTANDNTSGVTLLIDIMRELPEESRDSVAFVFFDFEEMGLWGSSAFRGMHGREMKKRLLINFDCVSDGDHFLFVLKKGARPYRTAIESAFTEKGGFKVEVATRGVFYPSDQAMFRAGVGVGAFKSTRHGLLYMDRIHTRRDTVYREENIEFLKNGAITLPALLCE